MNYNKFKIFDLILLSGLAFLTEFLGYFLIGKLPTSIYLSFSFAICIFAMIRWGAIGAITHVIAGVALVILKYNDALLYGFFYEVVANVAIGIPFLFLIGKNKNEIVANLWKFFLITAACLLSLCISKGIVLFFINHSLTGVIDFFSSSLLAIITNFGLLFLFYKTKSQLLTDMKIFLTSDRQQQEDSDGRN